jgi:hypothetical protein
MRYSLHLSTLSYSLAIADGFLHINTHFATNFVYLRVVYFEINVKFASVFLKLEWHIFLN